MTYHEALVALSNYLDLTHWEKTGPDEQGYSHFRLEDEYVSLVIQHHHSVFSNTGSLSIFIKELGVKKGEWSTEHRCHGITEENLEQRLNDMWLEAEQYPFIMDRLKINKCKASTPEGDEFRKMVAQHS